MPQTEEQHNTGKEESLEEVKPLSTPSDFSSVAINKVEDQDVEVSTTHPPSGSMALPRLRYLYSAYPSYVNRFIYCYVVIFTLGLGKSVYARYYYNVKRVGFNYNVCVIMSYTDVLIQI